MGVEGDIGQAHPAIIDLIPVYCVCGNTQPSLETGQCPVLVCPNSLLACLTILCNFCAYSFVPIDPFLR